MTLDSMFRKRYTRSSHAATSSTPNLLDGSLVTSALYSVGRALASWGRWNSGPRTRATATCRTVPRRSGRRRCGGVGLSPPVVAMAAGRLSGYTSRRWTAFQGGGSSPGK